MTFKVQRTLPPAAVQVSLNGLTHAMLSFFSGERALKRLEKEIKELFGVRHVFLVSSGKAALFVILRALKSLTPERSQVVIPAYTCFSVPSAVIKAGLDVTLCDINSSTFDFDFDLLPETVNKRTLCVIPSNLFGIPSDVERVKTHCKAPGAFVVEDAAQAMGARHNGKFIGTVGDIGFFSLARGKNITCGSGGIIVTNSDHIAEAIGKQYSAIRSSRSLDTFKELLTVGAMKIFTNPLLYWLPAGLSFLRLGQTRYHKDFPVERLSVMKAELLRDWKTTLAESNRVRTENSAYFFKELGLKNNYGNRTTFLRLPLIMRSIDQKEKICSESKKSGLGISSMYPSPINEIKEIKESFASKRYPVAKMVADRLITLPTHRFLTKENRKDICGLISTIIAGEQPT